MTTDLVYRNDGNTPLLALVPTTPGRALDCGCGPGDNARLLTDAGWLVTGVTYDPAEAAAAEEHCAEVRLADLTGGLPFAGDASYDLVVLSHVLEHLADPAALLAEVRRVLAPGGLAVVALPNVLHYRQRMQFLRGRFDYTRTGVMDETHLRFFTVDGGARLLTDNGFTVLAAGADGGLPWWRLRQVVRPTTAGRLDTWAARRRPNLFGWQGLFLVRPDDSPPGRPPRRAGLVGAGLGAVRPPPDPVEQPVERQP